ncbi:hypothetical protein ACJX0J_038129, partial [Zea mays]
YGFLGPFGTGTREQGLILWNFVPHPEIEKSYVSVVHEHELDLEPAELLVGKQQILFPYLNGQGDSNEYSTSLLDEMMDFGFIVRLLGARQYETEQRKVAEVNLHRKVYGVSKIEQYLNKILHGRCFIFKIHWHYGKNRYVKVQWESDLFLQQDIGLPLLKDA